VFERLMAIFRLAPFGTQALRAVRKRLFHETWYHPVPIPLPGKEGLQMACHNLIENRLFGIEGHIQPKAFTNDEIRFSSHECAIAG